MLIFIDESGDTGLKLNRGSSPFFVISLIVFDDHAEADACDQRINLLRNELGLDEKYEFHFKNNSDRIKEEFLKAVSKYSFVYFSLVINKDPTILLGDQFEQKSTFYKYACNLVFTTALPLLSRSIVTLDECGSPRFKTELRKYLNGKLDNDGRSIIKKLKQEDSQKNNLLQLADYVSGVVNRKVQNRREWQKFYRYISEREMSLEIYPR